VSYRIGIDVGGTFTDFLLAETSAEPRIFKVLSSPDRPADAVLGGLEQISAAVDLELRDFLSQVELIVHGTTIATNAVLTGTGARTALLTTKGFRDILQMRQGLRERPYDNDFPPPEPLVPRHLRVEINERLTHDGKVVAPLDDEEVRALVQSLPTDVEAIAICLMHAHASPQHERRVAEIVGTLRPDCYLSVSHEILPVPRLYDRASTTALNSYVGPPISNYLSELRERLGEASFAGVFLVMQSNGGVSSPDVVSMAPATTLLSGPASGPRAGLHHVAELGLDRCITIDMGGTSFDACLSRGGAPLLTSESDIGRWRVALPMLDIHTIGAGGGSIAHVEGGLLAVGPESAGAEPGPACYALGGERPTVTDADLVLGYVAPDAFFGGRMQLSLERAEAVISEQIAHPLGLDVAAAAAGIVDVVCFGMAEGIRDVSVRRGLDPRDFPLVVAGGAGPVHGCAIARLLGIDLLVVPREASIFCAAGMLAADFRHEFVRSVRGPLDAMDGDIVRARVDEMQEEASAVLDAEHVPIEQRRFYYAVDLRYETQWYDLSVPLSELVWEDGGREEVAERFRTYHDDVFGYASDERALVTAVRLSAVGLTTPPTFAELPEQEGEARPRSRREIYLGRDGGFGLADVYDAEDVRPGARIEGPALIEQPTTTLVILPGFTASCGKQGDFLVRVTQTAALTEQVPVGAAQ
jgi:N-methylhydantoinase A